MTNRNEKVSLTTQLMTTQRVQAVDDVPVIMGLHAGDRFMIGETVYVDKSSKGVGENIMKQCQNKEKMKNRLLMKLEAKKQKK